MLVLSAIHGLSQSIDENHNNRTDLFAIKNQYLGLIIWLAISSVVGAVGSIASILSYAAWQLNLQIPGG